MARFDLEREPSQRSVARAIADYGSELTDIRYDYIAMLVAQGEPISRAYAKAFPDASPSTARVQSSILCAHPQMRRKIADHAITARGLAVAALPRSVRKTVELMEATSEQVQLKAASSIQDRAGLPAQAELRVHAAITGQSLYREVFTAADGIIEADVVSGDEKNQPRLLESEEIDPLDELEAHKAEWRKLEPAPR